MLCEFQVYSKSSLLYMYLLCFTFFSRVNHYRALSSVYRALSRVHSAVQ